MSNRNPNQVGYIVRHHCCPISSMGTPEPASLTVAREADKIKIVVLCVAFCLRRTATYLKGNIF